MNDIKFKIGDKVKYDNNIGEIIDYDDQLYNGNDLALIRYMDNKVVWHHVSGLELVLDETFVKCKHELRPYVGLIEQFNYCDKCGLKESEF